jgi:hypothetical protein
VLRSIDIFACTPDGAVSVNIDSYLKAAMARKGVSRVLAKVADLDQLTSEQLRAVAEGNAEYFRSEKQGSAPRGKTRETQGKGADKVRQDTAELKLRAKAREVVLTVIENFDFVLLSTATRTAADAIEVLRVDQEQRAIMSEEFGVDYEVIEYLFEKKVINTDWLELVHDGDA